MTINTDSNINNKPNFYMALCKKSLHSYLIIGKNDGNGNTVLMRIGKSFWYQGVIDLLLLPYKMLMGGLSFLRQERLSFQYETFEYKAFDISFEQLTDFYRIIAQIQIDQRNNKSDQDLACKYIINQAINSKFNFSQKECEQQLKLGRLPDISFGRYVSKNKALNSIFKIRAKIPEINPDGSIYFRQTSLNSKLYFNAENQWPKSRLDTTKNNFGTTTNSSCNSCRHTALKLLETFLGPAHSISSRCTKSPGYKTKFHIDKFNNNHLSSFFCFPPPPDCFKDLDKKTNKVLNQIFKRLEEIPRINEDHPHTKNKFYKLKEVYLNLANKHKLNILDYMLEIEKTSGEMLFKPRTSNFFSRLVKRETSTKKLFNNVKKLYQEDQPVGPKTWYL